MIKHVFVLFCFFRGNPNFYLWTSLILSLFVVLIYLDMRVRERVTQRIMMLDSQMVTGYRSLATNEDGFLRGYRISDSLYGTKSKSLQHRNLNITRTYRISLTKDEQEALGNSPLAKQIRQIRAKKACSPENLLAMVVITKTCPCNIQGFFSKAKIENFIGKILIFFLFLLKT